MTSSFERWRRVFRDDVEFLRNNVEFLEMTSRFFRAQIFASRFSRREAPPNYDEWHNKMAVVTKMLVASIASTVTSLSGEWIRRECIKQAATWRIPASSIRPFSYIVVSLYWSIESILITQVKEATYLLYSSEYSDHDDHSISVA